jgi:hypothetical protein
MKGSFMHSFSRGMAAGTCLAGINPYFKETPAIFHYSDRNDALKPALLPADWSGKVKFAEN